MEDSKKTKKITDQNDAEYYRKAAQKHMQDAKSVWSTFLKTGIFILAVLGVGFLLCIAWFVSNSTVRGMNGEISASDQVQYVLACTGDRLDTEKNNLLIKEGTESWTWGLSLLSEGKQEHHDRFIDTATGETVEKEADYYTQQGEFAWRLQEQIRFYPGARGKLEMYLIPRVDGLTSVQLQLTIKPYKAVPDTNGKIGAEPQEDATLSNLLNGHILLFRALDDNTGYSDWMGENRTITVKGKDGESLIKDMPYKVTVYWIWPKQYRNLIYDKYSTRGDIFSNTENNPDYVNLIYYINSHKNNFFYSTNSEEEFPNTSADMIQSDFEKGVLGYNQADEYIGMKANFLYFCVNAE